jgi:plastocyanin
VIGASRRGAHGESFGRLRAFEGQGSRYEETIDVKKIALSVAATLLAAGLCTLLPSENPAGAADAPATTASAAPVVVHTKDFAYKPLELTVPAGTTVTFVNDDDSAHTVTAVTKGDDKKPIFDSGNMDKGQKWSFTFKKPGTYQYVCLYHAFMKAKIVVTEPSAKP